MFCSNCGNKLKENEKFCSNCGEKVLKTTPEEEVVSNKIEKSKRSIIKIVYTIIATIFSISILCITSIESYSWIEAKTPLSVSETRMLYFSLLRLILSVILLILIYYYFSRKYSSKLYSVLILMLSLALAFSEKIINLFLYYDKQLFNLSGNGILFTTSGVLLSIFSILLIIDSFINKNENTSDLIKKDSIVFGLFLVLFSSLIISYLFIPQLDLLQLPFVERREEKIALENQAATDVVKSYNQTQAALNSPTPRPTKTPTPLPKKFEDNSKVKIIEAYVFESTTGPKFALSLQNLTEKTIKSLRLAIVSFDKYGNLVEEYGPIMIINQKYDDRYVSVEYLEPSQFYYDDYSYYAENGQYVKAVVSEIEFSNGTIYQAEDIDLWINETIKNFEVEEHQERINKYSGMAELAELNSDIKISSEIIENAYAIFKELSVSIQNTSSNTITSFSFSMLEYDVNNFPVDVNPYQDYDSNHMVRLFDYQSLLPGQTFEGRLINAIAPGCQNYKIIINSINYADGTTWQNPYISQWILYNNHLVQ